MSKKIKYLLVFFFFLSFLGLYFPAHARPLSDSTSNLHASVLVSNTFTTAATVSNLSANDDIRAVSLNSSVYQGAKLRGFGVSIPAGSSVDGIEVVPVGGLSSAGSGTVRVSLSWNSGTSFTSYRSTSLSSTSDVYNNLGGAADLWGRSWSVSELSDTNFYVWLECSPDGFYSCRVDELYVIIYYTPPTPTPTITNTPAFTPTITSTPAFTPTITNTPAVTPTITNTPTPEPTINGFSDNQALVFSVFLFLVIVGNYFLAFGYAFLVVFNVIPSSAYGVTGFMFFLVGIIKRFKIGDR